VLDTIIEGQRGNSEGRRGFAFVHFWVVFTLFAGQVGQFAMVIPRRRVYREICSERETATRKKRITLGCAMASSDRSRVLLSIQRPIHCSHRRRLRPFDVGRAASEGVQRHGGRAPRRRPSAFLTPVVFRPRRLDSPVFASPAQPRCTYHPYSPVSRSPLTSSLPFSTPRRRSSSRSSLLPSTRTNTAAHVEPPPLAALHRVVLLPSRQSPAGNRCSRAPITPCNPFRLVRLPTPTRTPRSLPSPSVAPLHAPSDPPRLAPCQHDGRNYALPIPLVRPATPTTLVRPPRALRRIYTRH
jgi:hypothetical protein